MHAHRREPSVSGNVTSGVAGLLAPNRACTTEGLFCAPRVKFR